MEKIKPRLQNMFSQIDLIAPQDKISSNRYLDLGYRKDKLKFIFKICCRAYAANNSGNIALFNHIGQQIREAKNLYIWINVQQIDAQVLLVHPTKIVVSCLGYSPPLLKHEENHRTSSIMSK